MLLIPTKLNQTKDRGLGLFSEINIPVGMTIWKFSDIIDKRISIEDFNKLPLVAKNFLLEYSPCDNGFYDLDGDQMRHCNHSSDPNIEFKNDRAIVIKRIKKGEEILSNYSEFDERFRNGDIGFDIL